jgi:hypothetical protein
MASAQQRFDGARPADFLGTWQNVKLNQTTIVRIVVTPLDSDEVEVRVLGLLRGRPTDFGYVRGRLFTSLYPSERDEEESAILVRVDREIVRGSVLLRFNRRGEIVAHALLRYRDERGDVYAVERFAPAQNGYSEDRPPYRRRYGYRE